MSTHTRRTISPRSTSSIDSATRRSRSRMKSAIERRLRDARFAAHPAALRCLRARGTAAIQQPETARSPKFLGHPDAHAPRLYDPGATSGAGPPGLAVPTLRSSGVAFRAFGLVGLPRHAHFEAQFRRSCARCPPFVVTVTRALPDDHARLTSGWRSWLGRAGLNPQGRATRFPHIVGLTWLPPCRSFLAHRKQW